MPGYVTSVHKEAPTAIVATVPGDDGLPVGLCILAVGGDVDSVLMEMCGEVDTNMNTVPDPDLTEFASGNVSTLPGVRLRVVRRDTLLAPGTCLTGELTNEGNIVVGGEMEGNVSSHHQGSCGPGWPVEGDPRLLSVAACRVPAMRNLWCLWPLVVLTGTLSPTSWLLRTAGCFPVGLVARMRRRRRCLPVSPGKRRPAGSLPCPPG